MVADRNILGCPVVMPLRLAGVGSDGSDGAEIRGWLFQTKVNAETRRRTGRDRDV
jgi:hypothetical protein